MATDNLVLQRQRHLKWRALDRLELVLMIVCGALCFGFSLSVTGVAGPSGGTQRCGCGEHGTTAPLHRHAERVGQGGATSQRGEVKTPRGRSRTPQHGGEPDVDDGGNQHVHPRLAGKTPAQHRRGLRLRKLPARFVVPTGRQKLAAGRVTFIRRVSVAGTVTVLSQTFRVGKKHRGLYLRLIVNTARRSLTAYLNGRVLQRWPYELLND